LLPDPTEEKKGTLAVMHRRAVVFCGSALLVAAARSSSMPTKLDPVLAALLDDPQVEADREVVVMVGLAGPASEPTLAELRARGLTVRSVIGDVLTGSASLRRIGEIAAHPAIVKMEAAAPLYPETRPPPGG
jgi:hypothetical protein